MTKIDDNWKKIRLKHLSKAIGQYGANLSAGNYLEHGVRFLRTTDIQDNGELIVAEQGAYVDKELVLDYLLQPNDILFSRSGTLGRSYLHRSNIIGDFAFAGYLVKFRLNNLVYPKFVFYISKSSDFLAQIEADAIQTTIPNFNGEKYGNIGIQIPPLEIQKSIARFLDRKTAAIATLIAKKQRLIQLLEEKRTALINQAVTKGLNPNAPMKDSGIPWIGEIPEHWEFVKIGYFAQVGNGSTPKRDNADYWSSEGFPWLNSSKINEEIIYNSDQYVSKQALEECHLPVVPPESVLVAITGEGQTRGRSAMLKFKATINQHLAYIRVVDSHLHPEYLWRQLQAAYQWLRSESSGGGSTRAALTCEFLKEMKVPMPPLEEQVQITHAVDKQVQKINHLAEKTVDSIEKLQEYRRSLITAAVTGKLDIREVEPDV